ncbi:hypothetical protein AMELA_G00151260 [Ameiurus melas]|uniref:PARG helical domain-containing protein n=1 Tax=Ameiurus melas TaxID=219545 RepID=A0A7J6AHP9_AMEME|nr:hypothetical protein AMELA_G00151260 [Ameiurus melas]
MGVCRRGFSVVLEHTPGILERLKNLGHKIHTFMANNNSSQVKECLTHSDMARESKPGSSHDTTDGSKRKHSESSSNEDTNPRQKPGAEAQPRDTRGEGKLKKEPECHMELDKLSADMNHTVLIDINKFNAGRIVPYKGMHRWDKLHVKLPQCYPPNYMGSRWAATEKALKNLTDKGVSVGDVEMAIKSYNQSHSRHWYFDALSTYVAKMPKLENNFPNVISKMAKLALKLPELIQHPIPLLRQNHNHAITMSQEQISCLLANAFFCTFPRRNATHPNCEYSNYPTINFSRCHSSL